MRSSITLNIKNRLALTIDSQVSTKLGIYSVEEQLGVGGNGVVHKCLNQITGEELAIKFLISDGRKGKLRFCREIEFLQDCCNHNHIIRHLDSGEIKAKDKKDKVKVIQFYIMELASEGNLRNYIASRPEIELNQYIAQFRGLADALSYMHEKNTIHRDIKPENILIIGERWVLSDFGLISPLEGVSDISGELEKIGPVFWMSPEATNKCLGIQGNNADISKLSDVFQLAAVFWFIVNKKHPSGILQEADWLGKMTMYNVIQKALQHNPKNRYADGKEFLEAIVEVIEN